MVNFLNPLKLLRKDSVDVVLLMDIQEILNRWERLIVRERGYRNLDLIKEETLNICLRNYDGDGNLEAYVKQTALTVDISSKLVSLETPLGSDDSEEVGTLLDTLTEDNVIDSSMVKPSARSLRELRETEYLWADMLDSCLERNLDEVDITVEDIMIIISAQPIFEQVNHYRALELINTVSGKHNYKNYTSNYKKIVSDLKNNFGYTREFIRKRLWHWVSIYLQYQEVFTKTYFLMCNSNLILFTGLKRKRFSQVSNVENGLYWVSRFGKSNLFKLDVDVLLDILFDDLFAENSHLRLEVNGKSFYNVLSGFFVEDGNFQEYIMENLIETVLSSLKKFKFVAQSDNEIYFEAESSELDVHFFSSYFGLLLPFRLTNCGKRVFVEGVTDDFNQYRKE